MNRSKQMIFCSLPGPIVVIANAFAQSDKAKKIDEFIAPFVARGRKGRTGSVKQMAEKVP